MAVKKKIAGAFVDEAADAVRRAGKKKIKGYRVVNVDDSGKLVSQADNRVKLSASPGDVHDQKMWVAPEEKYVLDNYSNQSYGPGEQAQAIVEYEFDIDDVIQGSLDDVEPELSIRKGRLLRVTPLKDPLDMSKAARMKRAADQRFDTDTVWYHGTNVDVPADDGHWLAANPDLANDFASYRRTWPGAQIQPEFVRGKLLDIDGGGADIRKVERMSPFLDYEKLGLNFEDAGRPGETLREYAERLGYDGIAYKNVIDEVPGTPRIVHPDDVTQVFDPSNIRSVNAAFDPAKKDSSNLLASLAGAGVVGGTLASQEAEAVPMGELAKRFGKAARNLDMSKAARMKRAADQGFDKDLYHATFNDFEQFRPGGRGASNNETSKIGYWFSDKPEGTGGFWTRDSENYVPQVDPDTGDFRRWSDGDLKYYRDDDEIASIMQLKSKSKNPLVFESDNQRDSFEKFMDWRDQFDPEYMVGSRWDEWGAATNADEVNERLRKALDEKGFDSIEIRNTVYDAPNDEPITQIVIPYGKEQNIRSVNAAFDPAKKDSSNLLASLAGAGVVGGTLASQEAEAAPMGELAKRFGKATRKAMHGSPHDFDKFSLAKIGTGEGAQAYGHGLYFTSKEDIARFYRDSLSEGKKFTYEGKDVTPFDLRIVNGGGREPRTNFALRAILDSDGDIDAARTLLEEQVKNPDWRHFAQGGLDDLDDVAKKLQIDDRSGSLYTVEIPDESHMLDWDKPLKDQLPEVKGIARQFLKDEGYLRPDENGPRQLTAAWKSYMMERGGFVRDGDGATLLEGVTRRIRKQADDRIVQINDELTELNRVMEADSAGGYRQFRSERGEQAAAQYDALMSEKAGLVRSSQEPEAMASEFFREKGIPGITYKGATSGERNFVVFDDEMINLIEKGFADPKILAAAGAGAAAAGVATSDLSAAESAFSASDDQNASAIEQFKARREEKKPFYDKLSDMLYAGSDVVGDFAGLMAGEVAAGSATIGRAQRDPTVTGQELEAYRDSIRESFDVEPRSEMGARWSQAAEDTIMEIVGSLARGVAPAAMAVSEPLHPIIEAAVEAYRGIPEERRKKPEVLAESYLDLL